ncbi:hypothetical protein N2152v2_005702 [Parachlorella kessleri]
MAQGAARSRLATRESLFVKRDPGAARAVQRAAAVPRDPLPNPELVRKQKLKQRRDFSGLNDDDLATSSGGEGVTKLKPVGRPGPAGHPAEVGTMAVTAAAAGGKTRLAAGGGQHVSAAISGGTGIPAKLGPASRTGTPGARPTGGLAGTPSSRGASAPAAAARSGMPERRLGTAAAGRSPAANGRAPASAAGGARPHTNVVLVKGGQGRGQKGSGSRKLALEPMAVGKGRKQLANEALQARCDALRAEGGKSPAPPQLPKQPAAAAGAAARPATSAAPSPSSAAATAAAAAARKSRKAAAAKGTMQKQHQKTGLGMQTQLLITRPPGQQQQQQQPGQLQGQPAVRGGRVTLDQLSPQQLQQLKEEFMRKRRQGLAAAGGGARAGGSNGGARPQGRGSFYGSKQPEGVMDRVNRAKRRLSIDSTESLDDFIDDEGDYYEEDEEDLAGAEEDWRQELRSVLGGYDASKFAHIDKLPDRDMEAGYNDIQREELRSKRIAREEDAREEELERLREANKREKKRRKKGAAAFFDDD